MKPFKIPSDLVFNTEMIADPAGFAKQKGAAGWLYLNGEEFAKMNGGMSYYSKAPSSLLGVH